MLTPWVPQAYKFNSAGLAWKTYTEVLLRAFYTACKGSDLNNVAGHNGQKNTTLVLAEYALSKPTIVNAIVAKFFLNGGYLLKLLYAAAVSKNSATTSVQFSVSV